MYVYAVFTYVSDALRVFCQNVTVPQVVLGQLENGVSRVHRVSDQLQSTEVRRKRDGRVRMKS